MNKKKHSSVSVFIPSKLAPSINDAANTIKTITLMELERAFCKGVIIGREINNNNKNN